MLSRENKKFVKPDSIMVINMGGKGNIGDRAMALNDIRLIRSKYPNKEILVGPHTLDFMTKEFGLQRIPYLSHCYSRWSKALGYLDNIPLLRRGVEALFYSLSTFFVFLLVFSFSRLGFHFKWRFMEAELARSIVNSRTMFFCGGGYINDVGPLDSRSNLIMAWMAKFVGNKVVMSGQGLGPFHTKFSTWLLGKVIPQIDAISFRDTSGSVKLLQSLNIPWRGEGPVGDDAMSLPMKFFEIAENTKDNKRPVLGVNFRISPFTPNLATRIEEFTRFIRIAGKANDWEIRFFIFETWRPWEEEVVNELIKNSEIQHFKIIKTEDPREALYQTQFCDIAIGISYHFIVFSLKLGVPVFALHTGEYYRAKMEGLLDWYNRLDWSIPVLTFDANDLIRKCEKELQAGVDQKHFLQSKTNELASHYEKTLVEAISSEMEASERGAA